MTAWLELSAADSQRFGLRVARHRLDAPVPPADRVPEAIRRLDPDVAILRLPAGNHAIAAALAAAGMPPVHADTLVYYHRDLDSWQPRPLPGANVEISLASPACVDDVRALATSGFRGYASHYSANPLFPAALVLDGYVEWATSHLLGARSGDDTWLIRAGGAATGFATCRRDDATGGFEILLNAVHPDWQGRGLYRHLLSAIMSHYRAAGCREARISTQAWNQRVQRAWCALGFLPTRAYDTYHVNRPPPAGVPAAARA